MILVKAMNLSTPICTIESDTKGFSGYKLKLYIKLFVNSRIHLNDLCKMVHVNWDVHF